MSLCLTFAIQTKIELQLPECAVSWLKKKVCDCKKVFVEKNYRMCFKFSRRKVTLLAMRVKRCVAASITLPRKPLTKCSFPRGGGRGIILGLLIN
eukprot:jgi/Bigna1/89764/estExt_fgenesh1_pg.C_550040